MDLNYVEKQEQGEDLEAQFTWARTRTFDEVECKAIFDRCKKELEKGEAKVVKVITKEIQKLKPLPLNTVEATKLISNKLKIGPEVSMAVMEKLYNMGYLSYPRTETT